MITLAFESSCDETSVSVVRDGREILSNEISSQIEIHRLFGGVVPEIASRKHVSNISPVLDLAMEKAEISYKDIDLVAATRGPGLVGALLVGLTAGRTLAMSLDKPFVGVNHIKGHICANYISHPELQPPFVGLIVSGGHSYLIHVHDYVDFTLYGRTRDDAAGEAFDKVARAMGIGYPGFTLRDLDLIAVGQGPGSFTGLRISVTAAKILSQVLSIPLKGVSSLESLTEQVEEDGTLVPILDARRHRLYSAYFQRQEGQVKRLSPDEARDIGNIVQDLKEEKKIVFIGDGIEVAKAELEKDLPQAKFISRQNSSIRASSIGFLGRKKFLEEGGDNLYKMEPNYLRPSQAMREYRRKNGKEATI